MELRPSLPIYDNNHHGDENNIAVELHPSLPIYHNHNHGDENNIAVGLCAA